MAHAPPPVAGHGDGARRLTLAGIQDVIANTAKSLGVTDGAGGAGAVADVLAKAGVSADKIPGFRKSFLDFLTSKLSPDLMKSVLEKVPALEGVLG